MADVRCLSVTEIADHLSFHKDAVYDWVENKGMTGHWLGCLWRFQAEKVDA